jgi:serine protease
MLQSGGGHAAASLGPQTHRIIVGFRLTAANSHTRIVVTRPLRPAVRIVEAQTSARDVADLVQRVQLSVVASRQITPAMHVLFLPQTLYGVHVQQVLDALRADAAVSFAEIDARRYALAGPLPDDPLFGPTPGVASGQWYLQAPDPGAVVEGVTTQDLSATDAQDAWTITTGSSAIVIADVDTGVLFSHPDLLRANLGGRLLPGYDFVGEDYNPNSPYQGLGTYQVANDGDGWDPDPSDPGDWISSTEASQANGFFADCNGPSNSTWHGTRVVGIFGAITNNDTGIAGLTWGSASAPGPWVLPVRALGKCGGYDTDIIAGIEWAAGLGVTPPDVATSSTPAIPDNPYPADIINLSIGAPGACSQAYVTALTQVTQLGVLVVVSAGNGGSPGALAPVDAPANCSVQVPGVIAVAGLRNAGTKVGYSSFGPEVGIGAPAGNCINASGPCLRSIDTTTNAGTTSPDPAGNTYTNELNPNLGTSFSAPIVSGIAALMRSVNANLTPAQLVARLEASAIPFPANNALPPLAVCPSTDPASGECSCPAPGPGVTLQCGAGMVNALSAVRAAQGPIGVIVMPATPWGASLSIDASASVASCGNTIASFAWSANPANLIAGGASGAEVTLAPANIGSGGQGTLTLLVTDSAGNTDTETLVLSPTSLVSSTAPTSAGLAATACPAALAADPAMPAAPTVTVSLSPASVGTNSPATLTLAFGNGNGFDLTQSALKLDLPGGLIIPASPAARTSCFGTYAALSASAGSVQLTDAIIPAHGSCTISLPVQASGAGTYTVTASAGVLITGPAGANAAGRGASLTVTAPSSGGGGQIEWPDLLLGASAVILVRGRVGRRRQ